ncbi:putative endoplasmic reticulum metallopeptidase 1 [Paratrimastix pyriformis]|uniref:Vacuolar membrane protease n=1 Tax=Paratrimastix pyriformis TaxID=342808 RepID=A0ABQ8U994_9EUKA|nr:putative endoplasmic reticulum metallopeptidase 1 [Paratrimastix pyriformis]
MHNSSLYETVKQHSEYVSEEPKKERHIGDIIISFIFWAFFVLIPLGIYFLVSQRLAAVIPPTNNEEKARAFLTEITNSGPRTVGTEAYFKSFELIRQSLETFRNTLPSGSLLEISTHTPSGAMIWGSAVAVYSNTTNLVARIRGRNLDRAVLISGHLDSVPLGPGAADDGSSLATMLHVAHSLLSHEATPDSPYLNSVVLCFNGAEEIGLMGSHGFVSAHPWASTVKVFINLDGTGNEGRPMLFRVTGGRSYAPVDEAAQAAFLLSTYRDAWGALPLAHVAAQDLLGGGLITSATDFTNYDSVPGYDIGFVQHPQTYHTRYDDVAHLTPGSMESMLTGVIGLTRALADSDRVAHLTHSFDLTPTATPPRPHVFFDVLGWGTVAYTNTANLVMNWTLVGVLVVMIGCAVVMSTRCCMDKCCFPEQFAMLGQAINASAGFAHDDSFRRVSHCRRLAIILMPWATLAVGLACPLGVGAVLQAIGLPVPFLAHPWTAVFLFVLPALAAMLLVQGLGRWWMDACSSPEATQVLRTHTTVGPLVLSTLVPLTLLLALATALHLGTSALFFWQMAPALGIFVVAFGLLWAVRMCSGGGKYRARLASYGQVDTIESGGLLDQPIRMPSSSALPLGSRLCCCLFPARATSLTTGAPVFWLVVGLLACLIPTAIFVHLGLLLARTFMGEQGNGGDMLVPALLAGFFTGLVFLPLLALSHITKKKYHFWMSLLVAVVALVGGLVCVLAVPRFDTYGPALVETVHFYRPQEDAEHGQLGLAFLTPHTESAFLASHDYFKTFTRPCRLPLAGYNLPAEFTGHCTTASVAPPLGFQSPNRTITLRTLMGTHDPNAALTRVLLSVDTTVGEGEEPWPASMRWYVFVPQSEGQVNRVVVLGDHDQDQDPSEIPAKGDSRWAAVEGPLQLGHFGDIGHHFAFALEMTQTEVRPFTAHLFAVPVDSPQAQEVRGAYPDWASSYFRWIQPVPVVVMWTYDVAF